MVKDILTRRSSSRNIRATSWYTDPAEWSIYTDSNTSKKAKFAIANPTIELYVKSYNVVAELNSTDSINAVEYPTTETNGYTFSTTLPSSLTTGVNGIYNKGSGNKWCLASPSRDDNSCFLVDGNSDCITYNGYASYTFAIRPIVCVPTSEIGNTYHLES